MPVKIYFHQREIFLSSMQGFIHAPVHLTDRNPVHLPNSVFRYMNGVIVVYCDCCCYIGTYDDIVL